MNYETMMKFKALFENEKQKLTISHQAMAQSYHIEKDDVLDEADLTASEMDTAMRMRLRNREILFIKKIDEALSRINDGTFGECENCGEDIEARRLEVRPTATFCVSCKEESERREQLHIDGLRPKSLGVTRLRFA